MENKRLIEEVDHHLLNIYSNIGIDKPNNHEDIIQFVSEDVEAAADPVEYHSGDIEIAFRRLLETYSY